jgi:hypothetical protein
MKKLSLPIIVALYVLFITNDKNFINSVLLTKCNLNDENMQASIRINTTSGPARGSCDFVTIQTDNDREDRSANVYSWLGLPYAEPPVGLNRFRSPVPLTTHWSETRDATKWPNSCIQQKNQLYENSNFPGEYLLYTFWSKSSFENKIILNEKKRFRHVDTIRGSTNNE